MNDEVQYRLLKLIEGNPEMSQRELARAMGISLGKVNYCLRAVIARGLIKASNFRKSRRKRAYAYYLTRKGAAEKAIVTLRFLKYKLREYQELATEIEMLKREISGMDVELEGAKGNATTHILVAYKKENP